MTRNEQNALGMEVYESMHRLWDALKERMGVRYDIEEGEWVGEPEALEMWHKYMAVQDLILDVFGEDQVVQ